jgi:predicted transporter
MAVVAIFSNSYEFILNLASTSFFFYLAIALLSLIIGAAVLYLWERQETYDKMVKTLLYIGFIPVSFSVILICISSLAPVISLPVAGKPMNFTMLEAGVIVGVVLAAITVFVYFTADFIEDYLNMEYSVIFGGMMVVLAFVFMTIAFFLPTLATTLNAPISELELISISKIVVLLLGALVLAGIGVVLKKRNNRLV